MIHSVVSGNLGRDAELGDKDGKPFVSFSVASNSRGKNGKETTWVACRLYGQRATALAPYLTKGSRVAVSGLLRVWSHEGKAYVGLDVSEVDLLGGGARAAERPNGGTTRPAPAQSSSTPDFGETGGDDVDISF